MSQDRSWISSLAALGGLVAASLCCLPIVPLALAAGGASAAWFTASKFQPYLLGLSGLCIVFGFWQASRARQCSMGRRTLNFGLLAISTVMTAGAVFFPQAIANRLTPSSSAAAGSGASGGLQQSVTITSAEQFREAFNAAPNDAIKVVGFYSPT